MGPFEYRHRFSLDEAIMRRHTDTSEWYGSIAIEVRIKFTVKLANSISEERFLIDWESYAIGAREEQESVQNMIRLRLEDCWMSALQIRTIAEQLSVFAKQIRATGCLGKIPLAVDVEVLTAQREGEAISAVVERAMRPEILPPLYLYPISGIGKPSPIGPVLGVKYFEISVAKVRVEDVEEACLVMDLCRICGKEPIVGTQMSMLPCGHVFHYHCSATRLLLESNSCPTCHYQPACDYQSRFSCPKPSGDHLKVFWRHLLDSSSSDDDQSDDDDQDQSDDDQARHDSDLDDFF